MKITITKDAEVDVNPKFNIGDVVIANSDNAYLIGVIKSILIDKKGFMLYYIYDAGYGQDRGFEEVDLKTYITSNG